MFRTRQVLVKTAPPTTLLLSGMVTSVTKDAPFVQSAGLVGWGRTGVKVAVGNTADVSARDVFVRSGVSASVFVATGACVVAGCDVSLDVGILVCSGVCPVQAASRSSVRKVTANDL
jgi:hypothetical protein